MLLSFGIIKSLDRVWHLGLLNEPHAHSACRCLLIVIETFLSDRSLRLVLDGLISQEYSMKAGVSQGRVLGPTT